ncbi:Mbov_0397 family ICE element conjugal transfer ATPase [Spiroplasma floricola]|uniref:AAA+ ATPase domain-containing protein n=1 Tax=Spiroplasma floricola 23-6 TaxID=1336749 RepID=A0A2K8SEZ4_9MOLU|nr:ATP-binding protein [Spiroplasma floricola]AUB32014.1 hypothetical protein SFLOR_v1c09660 [Spiroplasma floricola 23-6]
MSAIIPKKLGSQKLKIKGNITLIDFICCVVFILIALAISLPLTVIGWVGQVITTIFIFGFLTIFLLPNGRSGMRIYYLIYLFLKFKASNKKYEINSKNYPTSLLIPYKELVGNISELGVIKTDKLFENKEFFVCAVELEGYNLLNMSYDEQIRKINILKTFWSNIEVSCSLLKLEKNFNKIKGAQYLNNKINELKEMKLTNEQINSRVKQLKASLQLFEENGQLSEDNFQHKYYLFLYCSDFKQCKEMVNSVIQKGQIAGLNINSLNGYEIINTIKYLFDPSEEEFSEELIDENKSNLKDIMKFDDCTFKKESFNSGEINYSVNVIRDFPKFPERCWMLPLMTNDSSVVINIGNLNKQKVVKKLQSTILNLQSNMYTLSKKELVGAREMQQELEIYNEVADSIGFGNEIIKSMNVFVLNYGINKTDLENKFKSLSDSFKESGFILDHLAYRQFEGLSSIMLKPTDPLSLAFSREVPSITLAEGFPYLTSELNDSNGFRIGENMLGDPVILDQFKLTGDRKNHNMVIMGTTGSGKTTLAKLLLNYHASVGRKVIVVDPEREYRSLCNYHSGNWVDVGNATSGRINPLQIFTTLDDEIKPSNKTIISNHVAFLTGWFEILFSDLNKDIIRGFSSNCAELYETWLGDFEDIVNLKSEQYPTMSDLIKFINKTKVVKENSDVQEKLLSLLKSEFENYGQYATLYNGYSTLIKNDNPFIVFDINTLFEKGQQNIIQAQLYLITAFIGNEVNTNFINAKKESFVLIDEAHLLVDKDKPIALNFIFQMVKRIRKRKGSMTLITQNPDDFLGSEDVRKKTMAMLNNVQYSVLMNLLSKNIQDIAQLYSNYGDGLSEEELNFIAYAKQGEGLLMVTGFDRHTISVKVTPEQFRAFNNEVSLNVKS